MNLLLYIVLGVYLLVAFWLFATGAGFAASQRKDSSYWWLAFVEAFTWPIWVFLDWNEQRYYRKINK